MKIKMILISVLAMLLLNACSPFTIASVEQEPQVIVVEEEVGAPAVDDSLVPVEVVQVEVEVGVGSPIPVHAIVYGNLPNPCAQLASVEMRQERNEFILELGASLPSDADCREDTIPFRMSFPINVIDLPEVPAKVTANGVSTTFDPFAVREPILIRLERTVCFGFCPIYTLTIDGDGLVTYEGVNNVEMTGTHTAQISPEQVQKLVDAFLALDYFSLPDEYTASVTDIPSVITSFTYQGQTKTITNYGGCMEETDVQAPAGLCELEMLIDEVANSAQWIGE